MKRALALSGIVVLFILSGSTFMETSAIASSNILGQITTPLGSLNSAQNQTLSPIVASWQHQMQTAPPSNGCYYSSYPNTTWISEACANSSATSKLFGEIGNSQNDFYTQRFSSQNYIDWAQGDFTSESGFGSEAQANFPYYSNIYSLQLNTNPWPITYAGHSTEAWEQFEFVTPDGGTNYNDVFIEFWLLSYDSNYGSCPSGWTAYNGDCEMKSNTLETNGVYYPANLYQQSIYALATPSNGDTVRFCSNTTCYAVTASDILGLTNSAWENFEFNVLGYSKGDGAIFVGSSGANFWLTVDTSSSLSSGSGATCQLEGSAAQEYNNLNLPNSSKCTVNSVGGIDYPESDWYWLQTSTNAIGFTVTPASGWQLPNYQVTITATPATCRWIFSGWTGSGSGSYTGGNNPATVTMSSNGISETANGNQVRICP